MTQERAPPGHFELSAQPNILRRSASATMLGIAAAFALWLGAALSASAQTTACQLVADARNPPEQILRCGETLEVRTAAGAVYHPIDQQAGKQPKALQLDEGALMIEFHPGKGRRNFQILTPHAIAAVRGTKWVVEVAPGRSSTPVVAGKVMVSRRSGGPAVALGPGEGADVSPGDEPIVVKRWAEQRVRALLARFSE
jgi:ferric-dicitrate binding protein FerR (iron transport regulator)